MSRELTEKKQGDKTPSKGVVAPKMTQPPFRDYRTPYTGNTQAVFTEVEGRRIISTHYLLNAYIKNLKDGIHPKPETKAESDKNFADVMWRCAGKDLFGDEGITKQDYIDYLHECNPPIDNNYSYTFANSAFEPVEFKVTKIGKVFGFTRQDNGECCNFTIVKDDNGGLTYKLQELDDFNLPEWVGG